MWPTVLVLVRTWAEAFWISCHCLIDFFYRPINRKLQPSSWLKINTCTSFSWVLSSSECSWGETFFLSSGLNTWLHQETPTLNHWEDPRFKVCDDCLTKICWDFRAGVWGVKPPKQTALYHIRRKIKLRLYTNTVFNTRMLAVFVFVDSVHACYLLT